MTSTEAFAFDVSTLRAKRWLRRIIVQTEQSHMNREGMGLDLIAALLARIYEEL